MRLTHVYFFEEEKRRQGRLGREPLDMTPKAAAASKERKIEPRVKTERHCSLPVLLFFPSYGEKKGRREIKASSRERSKRASFFFTYLSRISPIDPPILASVFIAMRAAGTGAKAKAEAKKEEEEEEEEEEENAKFERSLLRLSFLLHL